MEINEISEDVHSCPFIAVLQVSLKYPIGTSKMGAPRHCNERAEGEKKTDSCYGSKARSKRQRPTRSEDVMDCVKHLMDIWREISGNSLDLMVLIRV